MIVGEVSDSHHPFTGVSVPTQMFQVLRIGVVVKNPSFSSNGRAVYRLLLD